MCGGWDPIGEAVSESIYNAPQDVGEAFGLDVSDLPQALNPSSDLYRDAGPAGTPESQMGNYNEAQQNSNWDPYGANEGGWDTLAGGTMADDPDMRQIGRAVGSAFAGYGIGQGMGAMGAAGAEGAEGLGAAEGAGAGEGFGAGGEMLGGGESLSGAAAGEAGSTMSTSSLLDWLGNTAQTIQSYLPGESGGMPGPMGQFGWKDLLKTGGNWLINQYQKQQAQKQARELMDKQNPLNQPQRVPYQNASAELINNPQNYMSNNPFAVSLADRYRNNVIPAEFARSGNAAEVIDRNGSQFANAVSSNYNNLAGLLATYGGFNQSPNANGAAPLFAQSNQFGSESFRGLGDAAERIFGNASKPGAAGTMTGDFPTNPITNTSTVFT